MTTYIITKIADIINSNDLVIPKGTPDSALQTGLKIVFALAGAISVLIITISGLRLILSQGNPETLNRVRGTIIYAAIGLVVSISAYTIVTFVLKSI